MPYADAPLTSELIAAVRRHWEVEVDPIEQSERLFGGEESAAYRLGRHVVRIGPTWRAEAEVEWCHGVAAAAAARVAEAIAPCRTAGGVTVVRVEGRPVSLWPFVRGSWGNDADRGQRRQAADLLARLHGALAGVRCAARPPASAPRVAAPDLEDPELDAWLVDFDRAHPLRQPLHGDFYAGNVLVRDGRIVGLLDWDEAFVGPPERELAWAAWEWGDGLGTLALQGARAFIVDYVTAGASDRALDDESLRRSFASGFDGRCNTRVRPVGVASPWTPTTTPISAASSRRSESCDRDLPQSSAYRQRLPPSSRRSRRARPAPRSDRRCRA